MIELEYDQGFIVGVCEWWTVDRWGTWDIKDNHIWIEKAHIIPDYRNNGILKKWIKIIAEKAPQADKAYFKRGERNEHPRTFSVKRWLKQINREV